MLYRTSGADGAVVREAYRIERNTTWSAVDRRHVMVCVEKGAVRFEIEGHEYVAAAGEQIFIPSGTVYTRSPVDHCAATICYLRFEIGNAFSEVQRSEAYGGDDGACLLLKNHISGGNAALEVSNRILEAVSDGRSVMQRMADMMLAQLLYMLSAETVRTLENTQPSATENEKLFRLREALKYIRAHYTSTIELNDLTECCGISKQHLIRLFRKETGMTPIRYVNYYRMSRARLLIRDHPDLHIEEIAREMGYGNPHYFSRLFTSVIGQTPSQCREKVIQAESSDRAVLTQRADEI